MRCWNRREYGENITDEEKETARNMQEANAVNYDGEVVAVHYYKFINELEGITL